MYRHFNISNGARFTCYGVQFLYTQTYKRESALHVMVCPFSAMILATMSGSAQLVIAIEMASRGSVQAVEAVGVAPRGSARLGVVAAAAWSGLERLRAGLHGSGSRDQGGLQASKSGC